jgi:hypothetical protein
MCLSLYTEAMTGRRCSPGCTCGRHRHVEMPRPNRESLSVEERFWEKVTRLGYEDCWPWTGATDGKGYGQFWVPLGELDNERSRESGPVRGRMIAAHRVAYRLLHGEWPSEHGLHGCDNPPCCNALNPEHVHDGDRSQNMQESVIRGRSDNLRRVGERNPNVKLVTEQVLEMRRLRTVGWTYDRLGVEFGVNGKTAWNIVNGKKWKHL